MAIQMRRGQEVNFDADKMLPGEWAVSLDSKIIRMCFAPGVCVRMATYDAFEVDMTKVEAILAECQTIEEVVTRINTEVSTNAQAVAEYTSQAKQYRDEAEEFRNQAEEIVGYGYASKEDAGIIRGGDNYIDENGILVLTRTTTERELIESQNGGIRIISMDGESQQKQYSGKNLLNPSLLSNLSVAYNANDSTFSVLCGANNKAFYNTDFKENTSYTISGQIKHNAYNYASFAVFYTDGTYEEPSMGCGINEYKLVSLTTDASKTVDYIGVRYWGGTTTYKELQIEQGSTMTEYEPYVGGIASPNPEYEQDVDSVEVSEIWTRGKNLWNLGDISGTRYVNKTFSLEAGTYTISAVVKSSDTDDSTSLMNFVFEDGSTGGVTLGRNTRASKTVTLGKNVTNAYLYAGLNFVSSADDTFTWSDIQIEKGSVATPYEPYTETRETLSAPIVLRSIGDAKDVLCKVNGVYSVLRNIYNNTYKGGSNETWYKPTSANAYRIINSLINVPPNNNTVTNAICSRFISDTINKIYNTALDMNGKFGIGTSGEIVFRKDDITTLEAWKSWIASNNVTVQGVLKTPTIEPLPLADQIALHKLESFGGVTYLYTDSAIEPIIEVEYGTSKVGGYAIKGMNTADANALMIEQLKTLTNELATQIVAGSEA